MIAYMPLDWIVDEHSVDVSLPARFWRELDIQTLQSVTTAQRISESETEDVGLGKLGASPFGSRMPKENPGDLISLEAN
jgi:hypothetical protein